MHPTESVQPEGLPNLGVEPFITRAYRLLSESDGFVVRESQVKFSDAVRRCIAARTPLVAEAPTGTGKTLAYLIGALAAAEELRHHTVPVVIATATKALQDQALSGDVPRMVKAGLILREDVVAMKGRTSYLCIRDAAMLHSQLEDYAGDPSMVYSAETPQIDERALGQLVRLFDDGKWNGELDQVRGVEPKQLAELALNPDSCTKRRCARFEDCAYFRAKAAVSTARVVVTNQDLLLRDLLLAAETEHSTLDIPDYIAVIDEAHHFPSKALAVGSSEVRCSTATQALAKVTAIEQLIQQSPALRRLAAAIPLAAASLRPDEGLTAVQRLADCLLAEEVDPKTGIRRYPRNQVPAQILSRCTAVLAAVLTLSARLEALQTALRDNIASDSGSGTHSQSDSLSRVSASVTSLGKVARALTRFSSRDLIGVRWLVSIDGETTLHYSPLEAGQVLRPLLWASSRARPVLVSATLRGMDNFKSFASACGLPEGAEKTAFPHVFDYSKSTLTIAAMASNPKPAERTAYLVELAQELRRRVDVTEGTLVLLPSWAVLHLAAAALQAEFGDAFVKVQGKGTVKALVEAHKADIDAGQGSVLVGVATMAEGLDLPGPYCTHVCIAALPFAVPTSPIEMEMAEILGGKYFAQRSLPAATLVLIQEVGRLVRRESDSGRVTVFDNRLATSAYGAQMLAALPPFRLVVEQRRA